ncbi:MAG: sulfatase [Planctomycetes bacterium]|nr:sulfatase [Planctomycetota bacterium]
MKKSILGILFSFSLIFCSLFAASKPMNVLFISMDDMNADLACYGQKQVKTPNLDRLASMGALFDRAYCQQPLCGPSRASVMTGMRPNTIECFTLSSKFRKVKPNAITLGQYFQNKGYYVGRVGKIYHYGNPSQIGTNGHDDEATWQERFNPAGIDFTQQHEVIRYPGGKKGDKNNKKNLGISMAWWDPVSKDEEHTDGMVASRAIEMIDRNKDKPFFVAAGFFNPHCPYVAPKKYFDLYPLESITIPDLKEAKKDLEDVPALSIARDSGKRWPFWLGKKITIEEARKCKQAYYASISFVDAQVGRLMKALEDRGLMENTLIVAWSDHGYFLGEKGLWYKRKTFERSLRAPLIIAGPGIKKGGQVVRQPVELLDMYPTIVDQVGDAIPDYLEGRSLTALMENPKAQWGKPAISQVSRNKEGWGFTLRNQRWRYVEWNAGKDGRELYDHNKDPEEKMNLAKHPEYSETVKALSAQMKPYTLWAQD